MQPPLETSFLSATALPPSPLYRENASTTRVHNQRRTAMIWVGALRGWSEPTSHRPGASKLTCRPAAWHPGVLGFDPGLCRPVTWAEGFGPVARVGVEGTGTFGAGLARFARAYGLQVVEVAGPDRSTRRRQGKSDPVDAQAAARATLAGVATVTPKTREGQVEMIRVLRVARRGAMKARVAAAEQPNHPGSNREPSTTSRPALVRTAAPGGHPADADSPMAEPARRPARPRESDGLPLDSLPHPAAR
jgi:hypothetical protein